MAVNTWNLKRLDFNSSLKSLSLLLLASNGLSTHDTTTPVAPVLLILITITLLNGGDQFSKLRLVLRADLSNSKRCSSLVKFVSEAASSFTISPRDSDLLTDYSTKTSFSFDDGIWNTHLTAESW